MTTTNYFAQLKALDSSKYRYRASQIKTPDHCDVEISHCGSAFSGNAVLLGAASIVFRQRFIIEKFGNMDLEIDANFAPSTIKNLINILHGRIVKLNDAQNQASTFNVKIESNIKMDFGK